MNAMAEKIGRLPKWAQERIALLESENARIKTELMLGVMGDDAYPRTNLHLEEPDMMKFSPSRFRAGRFLVGPHWTDFIAFRMDTQSHGDNVQRVYVHSSGTGALLLEPRASNALLLRLAL